MSAGIDRRTLLKLPLLPAATLLGPETACGQSSHSLDGVWRFELDREDAGLKGRWWERSLRGTLRLPGSLPEQGIGDPITTETPWIGSLFDRAFFTEERYAPFRRQGNVKVPFWLQPDTYYRGATWFQRDIEIPDSWRGRRILVALERPHWKTTLWLDGREYGSHDSLSTPHIYDLGIAIPPGPHTLTLRVDNSLVVDIGVNSHSISDHTQGNWNGVQGRIELLATPPVWVEDVQVYPAVRERRVTVCGMVRNITGVAARGRLQFEVESAAGAAPLRVTPQSWEFRGAGEQTPFEVTIPLGEHAQLWDEFRPALYRLRIQLEAVSGSLSWRAETETRFGLREITTEATQFVLNGEKIFLRGTVECCVFPRTGCPPLDVSSWRRVFSAIKEHGMNHVRFHSWCPPEAAFAAADELGVYLQVEAASWPNQSTTLGDGKPVDAWLEEETLRILKTYGNHPSFLLMASCNEPGGRRANAYLQKWLKRFQAFDGRRLYCAGAGWPELPENQYHIPSEPRIQHWKEGLASRINARPPETRTDYREYIQARRVPVVSHEIGQWCVYPDFDEIPRYSGYLKAKNFEIFRQWLEANHRPEMARRFLMASGKLQSLCYKEELESALRTPGMGGFQMLQLNDFPGQGTALVGILNPFWESKGYIAAAEFRRFCSPTVPLARLDKRVFTTAETLVADLEVTHYGPSPLLKASLVWELKSQSGDRILGGKLAPRDFVRGSALAAGRVEIPMGSLRAPAKYRLVARLESTPFENDWDVWVYPAEVQARATRALVSRSMDAELLAHLNGGGAAVLTVPPERVRGDTDGQVQLGFSSIFWNTSWTNGQAPHTMGILCEPEHPALAHFPTEFHSNWQWWYLIRNSAAMILNSLPQRLEPIVAVVDDWFRARRLGLIFEAQVGGGRLLVTSIDFERAASPVGRQMFASLLAYVESESFHPAVELTPEQIAALLAN